MKVLQNDLYILMDLEQRFELSFFIFFKHHMNFY